jgi:hypothetical protein
MTWWETTGPIRITGKICHQAWQNCDDMSSLQALLKSEIGPLIFSQCPFMTKVAKLCLIGNRLVNGTQTELSV